MSLSRLCPPGTGPCMLDLPHVCGVNKRVMISFPFIFALVFLLQPNKSDSAWLFFQITWNFLSKVLKNINISELQEPLDAFI